MINLLDMKEWNMVMGRLCSKERYTTAFFPHVGIAQDPEWTGSTTSLVQHNKFVCPSIMMNVLYVTSPCYYYAL